MYKPDSQLLLPPAHGCMLHIHTFFLCNKPFMENYCVWCFCAQIFSFLFNMTLCYVTLNILTERHGQEKRHTTISSCLILRATFQEFFHYFVVLFFLLCKLFVQQIFDGHLFYDHILAWMVFRISVEVLILLSLCAGVYFEAIWMVLM